MVKLRVLFALVAVLLVVLTACGAAATPTTVQPPVVQTVVVEVQGETQVVITEDSMAEATVAPAQATTSEESESAGSGGDDVVDAQQQNAQNIQTSQRKIIYTSSLIIEVDDPRQEAQALYGLALRYGGFVSSANVYEYGQDGNGNPIFRADMQLRIDAGNFVPAQEELRGMANEVISEQATTQDVTAEYTDVESRMRNLQRLEEELQILLTEARERSDAMEEVLNIYREITTVREEIEVLQGRINVLSDLVSLATINVTLVAPIVPPTPTPTPTMTPTPTATPTVVWNPGETTQQAVETLTKDVQNATDDGIWFFITGLPRLFVWGIVLLVLYVIGRRVWFWARPHLVSSGPTVTPPRSSSVSAPPPPPPNRENDGT